MFISDSYFAIGNTHIRSGKPCQDYAIAKVVPDRAIAIVVDGCSSGGITDFGARLIAHSLLCGHYLIPTLPHYLYKFGLTWNDMLATYIRATIEPWGSEVLFFGDGCAVINYGDHSEFIRINYESNAPYYFVYHLNGKYDDYLSMQEGKRITLTIANGTDISVRELTPEETSKGILVKLEHEPLSITIFSDGVCSFSGMEWIDVCKELTAFKNTSGSYLKRRMSKAIQDFNKSDVKMLDDIAGAGLHIMR
jgi:hypothetical protein